MKDPTSEFCLKNFLKKRNMAHILQTRKQLIELSKKLSLIPLKSELEEKPETKDVQEILKCLLSGFFQNIAILQPDHSYKLFASQQIVYIHPSSTLFKKGVKCVMFGELVKTSRVYMRRCSAIEMAWAMEVAPHYYQKGNN